MNQQVGYGRYDPCIKQAGAVNFNPDLDNPRNRAAFEEACRASPAYAPEPIKAETEIDREMRRLNQNVAELAEAAEVLWKRLANVVAPPPADPSRPPSTAIESTDSRLGTEMQAAAERVDGVTGSLRFLMASLAL